MHNDGARRDATLRLLRTSENARNIAARLFPGETFAHGEQLGEPCSRAFCVLVALSLVAEAVQAGPPRPPAPCPAVRTISDTSQLGHRRPVVRRNRIGVGTPITAHDERAWRNSHSRADGSRYAVWSATSASSAARCRRRRSEPLMCSGARCLELERRGDGQHRGPRSATPRRGSHVDGGT